MQTLFITFDISSKSLYFTNWFLILIVFAFLVKFWKLNNEVIELFKLLKNLIFHEIKLILNPNIFIERNLIFFSLFFFILLLNLFRLLPYIFTHTSHLSLTLFLAFPLWMGAQLMSWKNFSLKIFEHLVPIGTPTVLIPFLVIIERIRRVIRPLTLSIRLMANMTAGHLLLIILRIAGNFNNLILFFSIINILILLLVLEIFVAFIQSFVFMLLSSIYYEEVNY